MQIMKNKSQIRLINITCLLVLGFLLISLISFDQPLIQLGIVALACFAILVTGVANNLFFGLESKNLDLYGMWAVLISSMIIMVGILLYGNMLVPYYDDCNVISLNSNVNISINDCIDYALENPNTTGAELVEYFEQNTIQEQNTIREKDKYDSILQRQLIP